MKTGDTISRYRITGRLGQGGMGVVYKAEDTRLGRPVALKFLPAGSLDENDRKRLMNEAQTAALIRHPNVCPIYDVEEADGKAFIAMAYLEGETLDRKIERGPLPIRLAMDIAVQIASGLQQAHELGVIHRDIKSANIVIGAGGHASILDFGLALRSGATRITAEGYAPGTPVYMSPEQVRGRKVDRRTDIWSLGVVLFEMLTGARPFRRDDAAAITHAIAHDDAPKLSALRADAPPEVQRIVETALAKDPEARWQRAEEMAAALKRVMDPGSVSAETVTIRGVRPAAAGSRFGIAVALAVCAAAGGAVWYADRPKPPGVSGTGAIAQSSGRKLVAVLPFQVDAAVENGRTLSDGLMTVLTDALSDFDRYQGAVMAIPTAEVLGRSLKSPADAFRIYGARLAITGSLQRSGDQLLCALQLVDTAGGNQIGAAEFDFDPANPRAAKNRAVGHATRMLGLHLRPDTVKLTSAGDSGTPGAYSSYLEGRGLMARYDVSDNIEKAVASFRRAVDLDPNFALAWAGLGNAYWRQALRKREKAIIDLALESAERAVRIDPNLAIVHSVLGAIYGSAGRNEEAIRELRKALELAPANAEAPRELARVYAGLGRFAEAEASYLLATKARPTDWVGHLQLAGFYADRERYQEAEAAYRQAIEYAPGNGLAARNLGAVYVETGRYPEAIEAFQNALKVRPAARIYLALAATYYLQHKFQEAVTAAETAIDLDSNSAEAWGNLGGYYKWVPGAESKVATALRKAIELTQKRLEVTPNEVTIHANLAEYHARLGDARRAMAEIAKIPEHARQPVASRLALAYELTGNRTKAIELIGTTIKNAASLGQIKDDPDLAGLWADAEFQKVISSAMRR